MQGYDVELMTKVRLLDAGPKGTVRWELEVTDFYANQNGTPPPPSSCSKSCLFSLG